MTPTTKPRRKFYDPSILIKIYKWMQEFEAQYRCKPAVEEISEAFKISTSVTRYYLARMEELEMGEQPRLIRSKTGKEIVPARSFILLPLEQANEAVRQLL